MQLMSNYIQYRNGRRACKPFGPLLASLYVYFAFPAAMRDDARTHRMLSSQKAQRRIALGDMGRADFFSHLLKSGKLQEDELVGNADVLLIAGSETTASTLTGLTYFLLTNPACLQRLTDEVRGRFASFEDINADEIAALPYLHGCIEEGLRLFPAVTVGLPRDSPGAVIDGHYIPEGVVVSGETFTLHTDPRYWVDPDAFRPERWIGDGFEGDDKRAFQTFSMGPRACLGLNMAYAEMRIALAKLVWLYDLEMASTINDWYSACVDFGLWKKPPLMVKFHPRSQA